MLSSDSDHAGVYIDKDFQKEKSDGFSKLFGAWNRRFLFLNMSQRVLYYSANPNSENHTEIKLRNVINVAVFAHKIEDMTTIVNTLSRQYKFRFETMSEFRDFMIYFLYVKKLSTNQPLFDPPECFLELIRKSQKVVEQHRKFIQAGKGQEVDETPESTMSGIQTISSTSTVNINPATGVSVIVDGAQNPDLQVLRSTEATELDARREERRRRQAELGTDDEADETMIKEKKRKIIKKAVDEDTQEQDKKVILPAKKHEKRTSEVPKIDEPKPKPSPETMEMPPKAPKLKPPITTAELTQYSQKHK